MVDVKTLEFDAMVIGGILRIPSELSGQLSVDQIVHVIITPTGAAASADERRRALLETAGAWADDPSIPAIFEEIDRERHADRGRDVDPML